MLYLLRALSYAHISVASKMSNRLQTLNIVTYAGYKSFGSTAGVNFNMRSAAFPSNPPIKVPNQYTMGKV